MTYLSDVEGLSPDHFWSFNNTKNDTGRGSSSPRHATTLNSGNNFVATPICKDATHALNMTSFIGGVGPSNSNEINGAAQDERLMGGWFLFPSRPTYNINVYKEGTGNDHLSVWLQPGGQLAVLFSQNSPGVTMQAYADVTLTPGRAYHIAFRFSGSLLDDEFAVFLDGKRLMLYFDDAPGVSTWNAHTGSIAWGYTTGTHLVGLGYEPFATISGMRYNAWGSWSSGLPSDAQILEDLFGAGAIEVDSFSTQLAADGLAGNSYSDVPLALDCTAAGSLTVDLSGVTFDDKVSAHVRYGGTGTLTIRNRNGSNVDATKCIATGSGSIVVENPQDFAIADLVSAIWNEPYAGYTAAGIMGKSLGMIPALDANVGAATLAAVAAETAATGAETAAGSAETAALSALSSSNQASIDALDAKTAAQNAQTAAATAETEATNAAGSALTASTNAIAAGISANAAAISADANAVTLSSVGYRAGIAEAVRDITLVGAAAGGFGEAAGLGRDRTEDTVLEGVIKDTPLAGAVAGSLGATLSAANASASSASSNASSANTNILAVSGQVSGIPAAVRDISNASPAAGSLGEDIASAQASAATASTQATSANSNILVVSTQVAGVPAAVRDVSNASPAAGSLGEDAATAAAGGAGITPAQVRTEVDAGLAAYDAVVPADLATLATSAALATVQTSIDNLEDLSTLQVRAEVDASIAAAALATAASIAALNDVSAAQVRTEVDAGLVAYDATVPADLAPLATSAAVAALNDLSAADVLAQVTSGLTSYDAATVADLPTAAAIAIAVRDVDNSSPAAGSLGEDAQTAAAGAGGAGYTLTQIGEACRDVTLAGASAGSMGAAVAAAEISAAEAKANAAGAKTNATLAFVVGAAQL